MIERIEKWFKKIDDWFHNLKYSPAFDWFCKIMTGVYAACVVLLLLSGLIDYSDTVYNIIFTVLFISIVPVFASVVWRCGFMATGKKPAPVKNVQPNTCASPEKTVPVQDVYLDDITFIKSTKHLRAGPWHQYDVLLTAQGYGWEMMKDWADYMVQADLERISQVTVGSLGAEEIEITQSYLSSGGECNRTPDLNTERGTLSVAGISKTLKAPVKIVWFNQTQVLRFFTTLEDDTLMAKYAETVIRRTFGTNNAMRLGKPIPAKNMPVKYAGTKIFIDSQAFWQWRRDNPATAQFELQGVLALTEKEPTLFLFEDGVKTREYTLQTEGNEDFTGKYFHISVRLGILGNPGVPSAQIDGFISDTPEDRKMTLQDIGYRMEGHFLACGGEAAKERYQRLYGQDLPMKGLKYPGYTTPSNVRLIGICPDCGKSFCFHGYAFYMTQNDVAYSDDGLDCCTIQAYNIHKETWHYEEGGKTFRYYNAFRCPHCAAPYIDYQKHPENKVFGVSGCVLLGRTHYTAP